MGSGVSNFSTRGGAFVALEGVNTSSRLFLPSSKKFRSSFITCLKMIRINFLLLSLSFLLGGNNSQQVDEYDPIYLGKFQQSSHSVAGDIFVLDEKTIYIQDFAHDGQAPDVFFWADGVTIPYITRSNLEPQISLKRFLPREDIVLVLPEENPSVFHIKKLEVWCRAFGISFGHIDLPAFVKK